MSAAAEAAAPARLDLDPLAGAYMQFGQIHLKQRPIVPRLVYKP
jgi:hypothetical protein